MKVYIAGPMTGYPDFNFPAFHYAASHLRRLGHDPLNPATSFDGRQDLEYEMYIREAVRMVAMADAIVLLDGWSMSKGATMELHVALTIGLPVYRLFVGEIVYTNTNMLMVIGALNQQWKAQRNENSTLREDEVGKVYASTGVGEAVHELISPVVR